MQTRWLSDTRNGQRQNPAQAYMSIGNIKNHKTNTTPFSGACNCHRFCWPFSRPTGWQFATEMAMFSTILSQEGWQKEKKKSNPVRHSRQLVGSIKQQDLSWEHITGMSPQKEVTCLWTEKSYSLPSGTRHDASTARQKLVQCSHC